MPTSGAEGRGWVYDRIADTTSDWIIDAGAGEGTYSTLARHLRLDARWVALEIHEPYIDRFLLGQKYDDVIVTDIRKWQPVLDGGYTLLLGDVLEHMPREDAIEVLQWHKRYADDIMVSVPIVYAPQSSCVGDEHEAHMHHWHFEEMLEVLGECDSYRGDMVGRFWRRRNDDA
jgi:hypothetical protein